jgi:hypothetical protein
MASGQISQDSEGMLIQGITDQSIPVQINISAYANDKVRIVDCTQAQIHLFGTCAELYLHRCR